jgi:hypothetical protein
LFTHVLPHSVAAHPSAGWESLARKDRNRGAHRLAPASANELAVRCVRLDDVFLRMSPDELLARADELGRDEVTVVLQC